MFGHNLHVYVEGKQTFEESFIVKSVSTAPDVAMYARSTAAVALFALPVALPGKDSIAAHQRVSRYLG